MNILNNKMINLDLRGFKGTAKTLLGLFEYVAKRESWTDEEIELVVTESTKHDDYNHLVETIREYCKH